MSDSKSTDELLDKKLTYHEFCDLMTDAWLVAEARTNEYPSQKFMHEMAQELESLVKEKIS